MRRLWGSPFLVALSLHCILGPTLVAESATEHTVTFVLVPRELWTDGAPKPADALPAGTIYLYRRGSYQATVTLVANEPGPVPEGEWAWIAEAPGYVSTNSGVLTLGGETQHRRIVWSVVPACTLDLSAASWRGVSRLDTVSLTHGSTYPVIPTARERLAIPAGSFLSYTVASQGVGAISNVRRCAAGQVVPLPRPTPPNAHCLDAMVHVTMPSVQRGPDGVVNGAVAADPALIEAALVGSGLASVAIGPTAKVATANRVTFFFLDQPAGAGSLALRHPTLSTARRPIAPFGGAVHEIAVPLRPRIGVELPIVYRPARAHAKAEVTLLSCGHQRRLHLLEIEIDHCRVAGAPQPLIEGPATYRFANLDPGQYVIEAMIDDERVLGLGDAAAPFLEPTPARVTLATQFLEEQHIWGSLLVDHQPVPGSVHLTPLGEGLPARVFPTDDVLEYHLFYFGQTPSEFYLRGLPADELQRPRSAMRGTPSRYRLMACDSSGACRRFHHFSTFSGSGRFDIVLDQGAALAIKATDADTGEPIERALTLLRPAGRLNTTTHFVDGRVFTSSSERNGESGSAESLIAYSDPGGEARHRALPLGELLVTVVADGYRDSRSRIQAVAGADHRLDARLEPIQPTGGLRVLLPSGQPARGATLVAFAPSGTPDYSCTIVVDLLGQLTIADGCLEIERPWALFHPSALLYQPSTADLRQAGDLRLTARSAPPLRVTVIDEDGTPVVERSIALRFGDFMLGPDHLLAAGRGGHRFPFRTDAIGAVTLPFMGASDAGLGIAGSERFSAIEPNDAGTAFSATVSIR